MKPLLAAIIFTAASFSCIHAQEETPAVANETTEDTEPASDQPEAGAVGDAYRDKGHAVKPKSSGIEALSVTTYKFGDPTAQEQLMLELINRARAHPSAEAQRFGIGLNDGLPAGTISTSAKPPLVFDSRLIAAARAHSQWMINTDTFSHTGTNGTNSKQRMQAAGYTFAGAWAAGENIAWKGTSGTVNLNSFTVALHEQLFKSPLHRENIMDDDLGFDQIGVGLIQGKFLDGGTNWNTLMVTQDYAKSVSSPSPEGPFVTGVAYKDNNANGAYDAGEGLGGVTVKLLPGDATTTTASAGGYAIPLGTTSGTLVLTFSGGAVPKATQVTATAKPGVNVKADLVLTSSVSSTRIIGLSGDLSFGSIKVGSSGTGTLTIKNTGNAPLVVSKISHSSGVFTGNFTGTISAGASKTATIIFKPTSAKAFSGTLTVTSNATSGTSKKTETGTGVSTPAVATPVMSPEGGTFRQSLKVKLLCATSGATIRYTTNGSTPTSSSKKYSLPFVLRATTTVKAKAFKSGLTTSATASETYTKK